AARCRGGRIGIGSNGLGGSFARLDYLLAWCQHHDHLPSFESGHRFNLNHFPEVIANTFEHSHTEFLVSHLAASEAQGHFGLVALFKETLEVTQLHLVVAFIGSRSELDFLYLDDL